MHSFFKGLVCSSNIRRAVNGPIESKHQRIITTTYVCTNFKPSQKHFLPFRISFSSESSRWLVVVYIWQPNIEWAMFWAWKNVSSVGHSQKAVSCLCCLLCWWIFLFCQRGTDGGKLNIFQIMVLCFNLNGSVQHMMHVRCGRRHWMLFHWDRMNGFTFENGMFC